MSQSIEQALQKLSRSVFRSRFHLDEAEKEYYRQKGDAVIERHAADFVRTRLAPAFPEHDGKQTPMRGHPVFKAQHACACCCRGCLHKWYKVPLGVPLDEKQQEKIVALLMAWIRREMGKRG